MDRSPWIGRVVALIEYSEAPPGFNAVAIDEWIPMDRHRSQSNSTKDHEVVGMEVESNKQARFL